jgi:hypothetical protein
MRSRVTGAIRLDLDDAPAQACAIRHDMREDHAEQFSRDEARVAREE